MGPQKTHSGRYWAGVEGSTDGEKMDKYETCVKKNNISWLWINMGGG